MRCPGCGAFLSKNASTCKDCGRIIAMAHEKTRVVKELVLPIPDFSLFAATEKEEKKQLSLF